MDRDNFTVDQKISCIKREINMRRRVYPKRVRQNKMSEDKADREIAIMESILIDYQAKKRAGNLFPLD